MCNEVGSVSDCAGTMLHFVSCIRLVHHKRRASRINPPYDANHLLLMLVLLVFFSVAFSLTWMP